MKIRIILTSALLLCALIAKAQNPIINPTATYTNYKGEVETNENCSGQAPLKGLFEANPMDTEGWNSYYEWRFTKEEDANKEPYLIRYEQDTEYTFTESGSHTIVLYAIFNQGNDTVAYTQEYWSDREPLRVTISESKLIMPNAFSPNHDDKNEIYKPKEYSSLVEFHAIIFNRWGQKIFEWDNPEEGWDGTHNGNDVKEGVYFVDVQAKGADGRKYHIRKDVNLLRNYIKSESSTSSY